MPGCFALKTVSDSFDKVMSSYLKSEDSFLCKNISATNENGKFAILKDSSLTTSNLIEMLSFPDEVTFELEYDIVEFNTFDEHVGIIFPYYEKVYKTYLAMLAEYGDELIECYLYWVKRQFV